MVMTTAQARAIHANKKKGLSEIKKYKKQFTTKEGYEKTRQMIINPNMAGKKNTGPGVVSRHRKKPAGYGTANYNKKQT
jgi:hypothetical protein